MTQNEDPVKNNIQVCIQAFKLEKMQLYTAKISSLQTTLVIFGKHTRQTTRIKLTMSTTRKFHARPGTTIAKISRCNQ